MPTGPRLTQPPRLPAARVCLCVRRLTPHLSSLSTSQLKLLTIYYNRAQGK
jgi:hypothetical protein